MLSFLPFPSALESAADSRGLRRLVPLWNPGNLKFQYLTPRRRKDLPLVVVLHGCGQEAVGYAQDTGWLTLARRNGFALLLVEQRAVNNPDRCFNWFSPLHNRRHVGEAASIAAAIQQLTSSGIADAEKVFITGLSAGGAMASTLLATYPELFAAGAIIAGIPYGCANWVSDARECMSGVTKIPATDLGSFVLRASNHSGPWPRISVWHGSEDARVAPANGADIVRQWLTVHKLRARPHVVDTVDGHPHRIWLDRLGNPVVEQYEIVGLGHGAPIATGNGRNQIGRIGPNVVDASISSTHRIAEFFGIVEARTEGVSRAKAA